MSHHHLVCFPLRLDQPSVAQGDLELTEICLRLSAGIKGVCHYCLTCTLLHTLILRQDLFVMAQTKYYHMVHCETSYYYKMLLLWI